MFNAKEYQRSYYKQIKHSEDFKRRRVRSQRKYARSKPHRIREIEFRRGLKRKFNITVEQYDKMLSAQSGGCAVCGGVNKSGKRLAVDHCHMSGKNRSLLCSNCNLGLGIFRDDPDRCILAARYLRKWKKRHERQCN